MGFRGASVFPSAVVGGPGICFSGGVGTAVLLLAGAERTVNFFVCLWVFFLFFFSVRGSRGALRFGLELSVVMISALSSRLV